MARKTISVFSESTILERLAALRTGCFHGTIVPRKQIFIAISLILLAGCATSPPESPWAGLTVDTRSAAPALDCGPFPYPTRVTAAEISYDEVGSNALEAYRVCSEANEDNVNEHAAQIAQLKIARKALVEAGQAQRNIANMKQQMLDEERRHHFWQSLGYWVLIVGSVAL